MPVNFLFLAQKKIFNGKIVGDVFKSVSNKALPFLTSKAPSLKVLTLRNVHHLIRAVLYKRDIVSAWHIPPTSRLQSSKP